MKSIVKFFLFFMTAICAFQLFLTFPTRSIESSAVAFGKKAVAAMPEGALKDIERKKAEGSYLDSISNETVLNLGVKKYTYSELKKQQLALGLDLKGGMSVVLQVDVKDLIVALSNNSQDPQFLQALDATQKGLASSQADFVTLFADKFKEISGGRKLATIFGANPDLRNDINLGTADEAVVKLIRTRADETVGLTYQRLKDRIDKFGVTQPNITLDSRTDRIIVELPGIDNPERARSFLQASAKLEFWDVYRLGEIADGLTKANDLTKDFDFSKPTAIAIIDTTTQDSTKKQPVVAETTPKTDTSKAAKDTSALAVQTGLFKYLQPYGDGRSAALGVAKGADTAKVNKLMNLPQVRAGFPRNAKFLWSKKPQVDEKGKSTRQYALFAIRTLPGKSDAPIEGDVVEEARRTIDPQTNEVVVSLSMNQEGARIWQRMTREAFQAGQRQVAIVLDNEVVSAPSVNGEIAGGNTQISGGFSPQEADDLANILQVGKLPARTQIIEENIVGPTLGKENINSSLIAMLVGFLLTMVFMIAYYSSAGVVAVIALLANFVFIIGAAASYGVVLTVPGIAGLILTIGMAVDANIVIYERIREELRAGKTTRQAIADGFTHSYAPIIDSHVTALITSLILVYFGLGPIKGFGVILTIGVFCTLFASILVSRLIMDWWTDKGKELTYSTKLSERIFQNLNIDFVGMRKTTYILSGLFSVISLVSIFTRGFDLGVDFKGGYSYAVKLDKTPDLDKVRTALTFDKVEPIVKTFNTQNTIEITTPYMVDSPNPETDNIVKEKVIQGLQQMGFKPEITRSIKVGAAVADDIKRSAWKTGLAAIGLIFLYILIRFRKWQFSLGATAALLHDVIFTLGCFSLFWGFLPFSLQVDQAFIAAILTIIGYSMNDTVIVFDRIREYLQLHPERPLKENINAAINNTLNRTIVTSGVTLLSVVILLLFGGAVIKGFAFALTVGMIIGTYSSIFIATPIVVDFSKEGDFKDFAQKPILSEEITEAAEEIKEQI